MKDLCCKYALGIKNFELLYKDRSLRQGCHIFKELIVLLEELLKY